MFSETFHHSFVLFLFQYISYFSHLVVRSGDSENRIKQGEDILCKDAPWHVISCSADVYSAIFPIGISRSSSEFNGQRVFMSVFQSPPWQTEVCSSSFYPDNHGLPCMFNKLFKLGEFGHFYFRWFGFCFLTQTFSRFKVIISIYFGGCSEQHHGGVRAVCRCLRLPRRVSPDGSDPWESPEPLSADCRCHFRRAVYFHHFTQEFSFISSHVHFSGDAELLFKDTLAPRAITVSGRVSLNICRASGRFSILRGSPSQQRGV